MDHTEIVKKLIGRIDPAAATHIDEERFENLKSMCELVQNLVIEIDKVAMQKDRQEYSVKEMGEYAYNFMTNDLGIV